MPRVLIVEDSPTQAQKLQLILESKGFEVVTAVNGQVGLEKATTASFDLILSDVIMPGLSGYDFCQRVKDDAGLREIPVILLTTLHHPMDIIKGLECGADNFITKPYDADYLVARVENILANKSIRAARKVEFGIELLLMGKRVTITREKEQILDALVSTFEELMRSQEREHEARVAKEALEKSKVFLQAALDSLVSGIAILDGQGSIVAVNAPWHHYANANPFLPPECGVGANYPAMLALAQGEGAAEAHALAAGIRQVNNHERNSYDTELTFSLPSHKQWFFVRVTRFPGLKPAQVVVSHVDITDRKRLEEQFLQAQKMEAFGQLAGGVAHDFNNLLTVIMGFSEILLKDQLPAHPSRSMIQEIRKSAERAASLTRQLLAFSRKQIISPTVLDLNSVVQEMDKMLRRLIGEDIDLTTVLDPNLHPIKADSGQIEQIIMNLAVNARDAMPTGGKLTIETRNAELDATYTRLHPEVAPGPYAMLAMSDTGCGMSPETKARIFEPFFTTKGPGKGTGLGLATVYGIVKQNNGHIAGSSELGQGTTFNIYLPLATKTVSSGRPPSGTFMVPQGKETILLVEDEDGVRALARLALESKGYTILEASSGPEALKLAEECQQPIHLMVTDVIMPQMSGRQLADQLTIHRPEIKVLYLSGYTDDAIVRHGVLQSGMAFLQKPFTPVSLARKVREVLDRTTMP